MRFRRVFFALILVALALNFSACASSAAYLRSQPASHFAVPDFPPIDGPLKDYVTLRCARISDVRYLASSGSNHPKTECAYVSADVTNLINKLPGNESPSDLRDAVLDLLMGISDYNCSNFLSRAYAVRSTFDLSSKYIGDIAAGAAAGTVKVAPGVSAVLDGINLLVGKANSNFDSQYYADKTFDALESAIAAERAKRKTDILARREADNYSLMDALTDARNYDDACSIKAGLQSLGGIAKQQEDCQKAKNLKVQAATAGERAATVAQLPGNCNPSP